MAQSILDKLLEAEARLDRVFAIVVTTVISLVAWSVYLQATGQSNRDWAGPVSLALSAIVLAAYVWYGVAVRGAARALDRPGWPFVLWVIGAPFLALTMQFWMGLLAYLVGGSIFVGSLSQFISLAIVASPLAAKFYFSGQLRSEIHRRTFEQE